MARAFVWLGALAAALALGSTAWADGVGCDAFQASVRRESGALKADFARPLIVSRGASTGLETFDLTSQARIDGTLRCRGNAFVSFEARIAIPADEALVTHFEDAQRIALIAAMGWSNARALTRTREMSAEAADYLRASDERGDVAVSGKVEDHLPGGIDVGLIWTHSDRSFIVLRGD